MGDYDFGGFFRLFWLLLCCLPLAIWKLVEIVWWLVTHVRVTW
jgi:hypothetical protein